MHNALTLQLKMAIQHTALKSATTKFYIITVLEFSLSFNAAFYFPGKQYQWCHLYCS